MSRPFYFFIQPTYWFGQQASTWFKFNWSRPAAYTLISQQSDEEGGLSEVSDSDFSEDTGTTSCTVYVLKTSKCKITIIMGCFQN